MLLIIRWVAIVVYLYGFFKGAVVGAASAGAIIGAEYYATGQDLFKLPETIEENFQDSAIAAVSVATIVGSTIMLSAVYLDSNTSP